MPGQGVRRRLDRPRALDEIDPIRRISLSAHDHLRSVHRRAQKSAIHEGLVEVQSRIGGQSRSPVLINNRRSPIGCLSGKAVNHMDIGILEYIVFWPLVVGLLAAFLISSIRGALRNRAEKQDIEGRLANLAQIRRPDEDQ